jgi:hypothetical protein
MFLTTIEINKGTKQFVARKEKKKLQLALCLRPVINNRDLSRIEDILLPNIPYRKGKK